MMEGSYANDNESFKKFLLDFCTNVIVETEESEDLPFRLVSKQLTTDELEAETLEWSARYLSKYNCPHTLLAAISRNIYQTVQNIDISELQDSPETKDELDHVGGCGGDTDIIAEEKQIILDANKVFNVVTDCVHDVCKKWKEDLPELSPPKHMLYSCTHEIKNTRRKMEDRHIVYPDLNSLFGLKNSDNGSFYAVFDGHAGMEAANYAAAHVPYHFVHSDTFPRDPPSALKAAFKSTDEKFIIKATRERLKSGSTGVLAYIEKNNMYISWLGDSQALLVRQGHAVTVMNPHKPEREDERARIEALGGCILFMGTWRVNGNLSVSRAIGDVAQKRFISSDADTTTVGLDGSEDYLILACDGLWDVITPDMAVKLVYDNVQTTNGDLSGVARHLVDMAKDLGSSDNITVTVIFFKHDISPPDIPQLFNFGVSESQGKNDSNDNANCGPNDQGENQTDKGDNSNSTNQSNSSSGNKDNTGQLNDGLQDNDQSEFIYSNEVHTRREKQRRRNLYENGAIIDGTVSSPKKPVLTRNEPVFIIESTEENKRHQTDTSPVKLENKNRTISGFRRHFEAISVTDLKSSSIEPEIFSTGGYSKLDLIKMDDSKENVIESDHSSLNSGYLTNSKHSEPYYNKSMFSPRKHHRRKNREKSNDEPVADIKRSRRHRELSPIVWNHLGSTKPTVNNYRLAYSNTTSIPRPHFPGHSHLNETPISVRKSLPDLSLIDKYKSPKVSQDVRHIDSGTLYQSYDIGHTFFKPKTDTTPAQLPKLDLSRSQSNAHSKKKFPSTWKPRKLGKMVSGNMVDVPPSSLAHRRIHTDRQH